MRNTRLAQRYAKALFDLAQEQQTLEPTKTDMEYLLELSKVKDFKNMLLSPVVSTSKKLAVSNEVLKNKVGELSIAFVSLIIRKKRAASLPEIAKQFVAMYNDYKHILNVEIQTASPLDNTLREKLIEKIKEQTHSSQILLDEKINEDVIGGFALRYKDKLYDATIRRQLNELRKELV